MAKSGVNFSWKAIIELHPICVKFNIDYTSASFTTITAATGVE